MAIADNKLLTKLKGGDRRSIGRSNAVIVQVKRNPRLLLALVRGMYADDPLVRMRAADAVEKITAQRPELLKPYGNLILRKAAPLVQQEVRWHVAQIIPRLELSARDVKRAVQILNEYLSDKSSIVKTFAMQALADLAQRDESLRKRVLPLVEKLVKTGTPAMKARGRKLLRQWEATK